MKARTYRSKKAKGKRLEAKLCSILRSRGIEARPMPLSGALAHFKSDVYTMIPYSFEAKNKETHQIWQEWEQARGQASGINRPILVISGNNRPILAVLQLEHLADLLAIEQNK
jgi:hypothetical protein